VLPIPNDTFAAYIFFLFFGPTTAPGPALPALLGLNVPPATAASDTGQSGVDLGRPAKSPLGGALGAAVRRLSPDSGESFGFYLLLGLLLAAIAAAALLAYRRRRPDLA
jgi:LPXTG-motif cell wall-anchored protein